MIQRTWLTLGATLGLAACGSSGVASSPVDAAMPVHHALPVEASRDADLSALLDDAATEAQYDIPHGDDASEGDGSIVPCSSRSGYFACGSNVCNRAIQACLPGSLCVAYSYLAPSCGACPTCACLRDKTLLSIESCQEDTAGSVAISLYPIGGAGTPCKVDSQCHFGLCMNGTCECQPAGAVATRPGNQNDCCSGGGGNVISPDGGLGPWICGAERGSGCTTAAPDCYGGPCEGGICTCIGPGGPCANAPDCCDGRCVQEPGDRVCQ
jgi:hypothetical protein